MNVVNMDVLVDTVDMRQKAPEDRRLVEPGTVKILAACMVGWEALVQEHTEVEQDIQRDSLYWAVEQLGQGR